MRLRLLSVLVALAIAGCAGAGGSDGGDSADQVQLTVINEFVGTVTAYAVWGTGRIRLGDVGQNRTRIFSTPRRANSVAVGLEIVGAPPAATSAGPSRLSAGAGGAPDPTAPYEVSEAIEVAPGDAVEFRLSAARIFTVRRLQPGL
jgi:hypothetical protein